MRTPLPFHLILLTLLLSAPGILPAQPASHSTGEKINKLIDWADSCYSIDDQLVHGYIYPLPDSRIQNHPYLLNDEWIRGKIFIKEDVYDKLLLKYDLTTDDLILKARFTNNSYRAIEMIDYRIDSFLLGNIRFVNSKKFFPEQEISTFYEQIIDSKLVYVRKHQKSFIPKYDNLTPNGKFSNRETEHYFIEDGKLTRIRHKKDFIGHFDPSVQSLIRKYIRKNMPRFKKTSHGELKELLNYCNQIITR